MKKGTDSARASKPSFAEFMHASRFLGSAEPRFAPPIVARQEQLIHVATSQSVIDVLKMLFERVDEQVVRPILAASTADAVKKELAARVPVFAELMTTLQGVLVAESSHDHVRAIIEKGVQGGASGLVECADRFGGPDAAAEAHFAAQTYAAAISTAERITQAGRPQDQDAFTRSCELAREFQRAAMYHELGAMLVIAIGTGRRATDCATEFAFAAMRGGALDAYASAREAEGLHRHGGPVSAPEALALDDEDRDLSEFD